MTVSICRYSLDALAWTTLPKVPRFGSDYQSEVDDDVIYETDGGVVWSFQRFKRGVWELPFRVTEAQLASYRTMHNLVRGVPFYFQFRTHTLYCRKEQGFNPKMLTEPTLTPMYDYSLILREEILPLEILA